MGQRHWSWKEDMQYYVIAPDGQKYGPADVPTLNAWIAEGRLLPDTQLQDVATNAVMAASMVPGLAFPTSQPAAPYAAPTTPSAPATPGFEAPAAPVDPGAGQPQQPYQAPQAPQQPYQAPQQPQQPYQQPQQPYQQPQQPYQQGPYSQPPGSNYPRPMSSDDGSGDVQKAYIFGAISFICCPIIFGVLGIVFAIQAKNKGNERGQGALILSICGLVFGIFISIGLNVLFGGFGRF